jgi:hypothetical protein
MKRSIFYSLLALLLAASAALGGFAAYAMQPRPALAYLPVVANGAQPLPPAPPIGRVVLIESDTTFVTATRDDESGRIFVAYIDRAHGNRAHFTELISDTLVEVPTPLLPAIAPSFTPPGSPKDADAGAILITQHDTGAIVWWFVTSRPEGDPDGPFQLLLLRFKMPKPMQVIEVP